MQKTANATGGVQGATVATTGHTGDPFDAVYIDPGAQLTYDDSLGSMAFKVTNAGSGNAKVAWVPPPGQTRFAGRVELYLPAPGPTDPDWESGDGVGGAGRVWSYFEIIGPYVGGIQRGTVAYTSNNGWENGVPGSTVVDTRSGLVIINRSTGEPYFQADNGTLLFDTWIRLEFDIEMSNPGSWSFKLFPDVSTTTPSVAWSSSVTWTNAGDAETVTFGSSSHVGGEYWFNNLVINDTGMVGPSSDGWINIGGATSSPLSFTAHADDDGKLYRAKYTSARGSVASTPAKLTIAGDPADVPDPPDEDGDWNDDHELPDAIAPAEGPGSATVLDLVRQFSAAVRRPVRITGPGTITMIDVNTPYLPAGFAQTDAEAMYHAAARTALAGERTLSLEENDLALSATAELVSNDARLVASDWRIPGQLPCYGLRPTPVSRVSYTFTPDGCSGSVDFDFPMPFGIVRRA